MDFSELKKLFAYSLHNKASSATPARISNNALLQSNSPSTASNGAPVIISSVTSPLQSNVSTPAQCDESNLPHSSPIISQSSRKTDSSNRLKFPSIPPGKAPPRKRLKPQNSFPGDPPGQAPLTVQQCLFPGNAPGRCPPRKKPIFPVFIFPGIAPTPCPPRKCGAPLLGRNARSQFVKSGNQSKMDKCPAPPNFPLPPPELVARKLFWQSLRGAKLKGSMWEAVELEKTRGVCISTFHPLKTSGTVSYPAVPVPRRFKEIQLNYEKLTSLFFENPSTRKNDREGSQTSRPLSSGSTTDATGSVLDGKRRQNIEICLKGLGLLDGLGPVKRTVVDLIPFISKNSEEQVNCETLQIVVGLYPTPEEEKALNAQLIANPDIRFPKAEAFLVEMLQIFAFKVKAECCLTHLTLKAEVFACTDNLAKLDTCVSRVLESTQTGALREVMTLILKIGNFLNYGSGKGISVGFSLESLPLLRSVKSVDSSTSLLKLVAETVEQQGVHYWDDLSDSIGSCQIAQEVQVEDFTSMLAGFKTRVMKVDNEVQKLKPCDGEVSFVDVFSRFVQTSQVALQGIQTLLVTVEEKLKLSLKLFAENGKSPREGMDLLRRLNGFWKDLQSARNEILEKEQKLKEQASRASRSRGHHTARLPGASPPIDLKARAAPLTARPANDQLNVSRHIGLTSFCVSSQSTADTTAPSLPITPLLNHRLAVPSPLPSQNVQLTPPTNTSKLDSPSLRSDNRQPVPISASSVKARHATDAQRYREQLRTREVPEKPKIKVSSPQATHRLSNGSDLIASRKSSSGSRSVQIPKLNMSRVAQHSVHSSPSISPTFAHPSPQTSLFLSKKEVEKNYSAERQERNYPSVERNYPLGREFREFPLKEFPSKKHPVHVLSVTEDEKLLRLKLAREVEQRRIRQLEHQKYMERHPFRGTNRESMSKECLSKDLSREYLSGECLGGDYGARVKGGIGSVSHEYLPPPREVRGSKIGGVTSSRESAEIGIEWITDDCSRSFDIHEFKLQQKGAKVGKKHSGEGFRRDPGHYHSPVVSNSSRETLDPRHDSRCDYDAYRRVGRDATFEPPTSSPVSGKSRGLPKWLGAGFEFMKPKKTHSNVSEKHGRP